MVKIIEDIRIKAGQRSIAKVLKTQQRKVQVCNLRDAKSVALLVKIVEESDLLQVQKFAKFMKGEFGTRKVFVLGYYDAKKDFPEFLQSKIEFDFFTKDDLDWKGIPKGPVVDNFSDENFDILIDMNNYYNVPLRHILSMSTAKLKVGRFSEENKPFFDIMLASNSDDFEEYCNQLVKYLTMINPK
jgi:hypothetical protein